MARFVSVLTALTVIFINTPTFGAHNPELIQNGNMVRPQPLDIQTEMEVECDVGMVHNRISNSTVERITGTNDWTILIGDDSAVMPSMRRQIPGQYAPINDYLYFGSLRIGQRNKLLHLDTETSDTLLVDTGPEAVSDFDTYFNISDQSDRVPPLDRLNIRVTERTYAWSESDADDFIIYDFWLTNLNGYVLDSIYVALHADCDVSTAEGGSGAEAWSRDDMVDYYRDDATGEYISYMYDGNCPIYPGDDQGGRHIPKESEGYIGSRLLYCPPRIGETEPGIQSGHGWWDWNSDPETDAEWMRIMSDGLWLDPPPSVHDYRFLQKLGPFNIPAGDSIRIAFAFGIGDGLNGLRSNLNNAHLLFDNNYVYYNLPPDVPSGFEVSTSDGDFALNWNANTDDFAGYNVYYSESAGGPFTRINSALIDTTYYLFSPSGRHLYYFYVTAEDSGGAESMPSDIRDASTLPTPPADFHAASGNSFIGLSWTTVDSATSYKIYRATTQGGPYQMIRDVAHPGATFNDSNVVQHQQYYYVATTMKWGYESPYSGEIQIAFDPLNNGRVLLIDDYAETDQNGEPLLYQDMRRIYERWGTHHFDYDLWVIADQGMPDTATLGNYQAAIFASDADLGNADYTWWYDVGELGGGNLRYYLDHGGHLLAIGSAILEMVYNTNPPHPGDFEYDWFGVDSLEGSGGMAWDYGDEFTWAVGRIQGYPDSMKIDVAKNGDQVDHTEFIYRLRPDASTLYVEGLTVYGDEPYWGYGLPNAVFYRPGGVAKTCFMAFDLHNMPNPDIEITLSKVLRDEFGCTYYQDPPPLPPWQLTATGLGADSLFLQWDPSDESDVVATRIYRSVNNQPFTMVLQCDPDICEYTDTDITPGNGYAYKLTCVDFAGQEGDFSYTVNEFGGRPPAPGNLHATANPDNITLTWSYNPGPDVSGIRIYKRVGFTGDFSQAGQVGPGVESYQDNDVTIGQSYLYYITAISSYGPESYPSDTCYAFFYGDNPRSGALIVNGCDWSVYGSELYNMYLDRAVTGIYSYRFWDLFIINNSQRPYPETVIGEGPLDPAVLNAFSVVIWVGNNFNGDLELWQEQEINLMNYLNSGGNILLLCRFGSDFLSAPFAEYAHITDFNMSANPNSLIAVGAPFVNIGRLGSQSFTDYVRVNENYTQVLFHPAEDDTWAAGFRCHPEGRGQFAYIAGRTYRWNHSDLQTNCMALLDSMGAVGIEDKGETLPDKYELCQNFPNPFNPSTTIRLGLPKESDVTLVIYDILGREVRRLVEGKLDAGYTEVVWDGKNGRGKNIGSGIYFYRLRAEGITISKKMVMLK